MKIPPRFVPTFSTLLFLGAATTALGAPPSDVETTTKVVRFKDLDLATGAGAEKLYDRIAAAARLVCRNAPKGTVRACRTRAIDDAVRSVGNPLLSSIHRSTAERVEEVVSR